MSQRKYSHIKTFVTSLTFTEESQGMILDSGINQTMPKQEGTLVVTCLAKLVFRLSLSIHRHQTRNPSVWTIRWWKRTDCRSWIGGGGEFVIRTPISNPSLKSIHMYYATLQVEPRRAEASGSKIVRYMEASVRI